MQTELKRDVSLMAGSSQTADQIQNVTADIQRLESQLHQNQEMMGKLLTIVMGQ